MHVSGVRWGATYLFPNLWIRPLWGFSETSKAKTLISLSIGSTIFSRELKLRIVGQKNKQGYGLEKVRKPCKLQSEPHYLPHTALYRPKSRSDTWLLQFELAPASVLLLHTPLWWSFPSFWAGLTPPPPPFLFLYIRPQWLRKHLVVFLVSPFMCLSVKISLAQADGALPAALRVEVLRWSQETHTQTHTLVSTEINRRQLSLMYSILALVWMDSCFFDVSNARYWKAEC